MDWRVAMRPGLRRQLEAGGEAALRENERASVRAKAEQFHGERRSASSRRRRCGPPGTAAGPGRTNASRTATPCSCSSRRAARSAGSRSCKGRSRPGGRVVEQQPHALEQGRRKRRHGLALLCPQRTLRRLLMPLAQAAANRRLTAGAHAVARGLRGLRQRRQRLRRLSVSGLTRQVVVLPRPLDRVSALQPDARAEPHHRRSVTGPVRSGGRFAALAPDEVD